MINNAGKRKIGNSRLPQMSNTIVGWFQDIEFGLEDVKIIDFEKVSTIDKIKTRGVVQPPRPETIEIQPEGIRNWEWLEIHCLPNLQLNVNEYIYYKGLKYKVMQKENFEAYGYIHYLILEAYRNDRTY